jgi:ankyrin repeat protein
MPRGSLLLILLAAGCAGPSVDARGMSFEEYQRYQQIRPFVQDGGDLDKPAADGRTPLTDALHRDYGRLARYLVSQGASVRKQDANGTFPIHHAVGCGDLETTAFLLAKGADADAVAAVVTPIALAVARQDLPMIRLLLGHRANPDLAPILNIEGYSHVGKTPWNFSEGTQHWTLDLVQLGWPEDCLNPPLATAVRKNNLDAATLLLQAGARTLYPQKWARELPPLLTATDLNLPEMVGLLLKHGADPRGTQENTSWHGNSTALHLAAARGRIDIVRLLVEAGAPVSLANDGGDTPLKSAIRGSVGLVEIREAVNVRSDDGQIVKKEPPQSEPDEAHRAVIEFLRSRGAK